MGVDFFASLLFSTNPWVLPLFTSFLSPFLPLFSPPFLSNSSATVCVRVCVHPRGYPSAGVYFCLPHPRVRACACACPSNPQKPLRFPPVAFSTAAKAGSSPRRLSAASGGAGVGLPGHVSGWWPCPAARTDARQNSLCLSEVGMREHCESQQHHVEKSCSIKGFCSRTNLMDGFTQTA